LHDDPLLLLRSIGQLAGAQLPLDRPGQAITNYQSPAEARIRSALASNPLRRLIFNWVLKNARILIRNRENLRFERTRLFGRARLIFLELGCKFQAQGFLADARDIFYLTVEEVLSLVEGTAVTTDFKSLVTLRRAEFEAYQNQPFPPNRFETRGIPYQGLEFGVHIQNPKSEIVNLKSLRGLGCSPGVVRGRVRIVTDPKTAQLQPGEILVAERTDPGWIMLFPMAAGLLVEYGSLLSHSAIVSRELGLPAIVSLTGVTHWLKDGEWVEFDGSTGIVTRMESLDV
jgi:pyruvate,water dikinase